MRLGIREAAFFALVALCSASLRADEGRRIDVAAGPAFGEQAAYLGSDADPASHHGFHIATGVLFTVWKAPAGNVRIDIGPRLAFSWYGMDKSESKYFRLEGWTGLVDVAFEVRLSAAVWPSKHIFIAPAVGASLGFFFYSFEQAHIGTTCHHSSVMLPVVLHTDVAIRWEPMPHYGFFVAPGLTMMVPTFFDGDEAAFACADTNHTYSNVYLGFTAPRASYSIDAGWQVRF